MLATIRRWVRRQAHTPESSCLEREAGQRRDLESQVQAQLSELIAYLEQLGQPERGRNPPEVL